MIEVILKRFEEPDEVTTFEKGTFETVTLGGMTIGRATSLAIPLRLFWRPITLCVTSG